MQMAEELMTMAVTQCNNAEEGWWHVELQEK